MKGCGHGKTFKEPCIECRLVSAREGLAWARQGVERYSKIISDLEQMKPTVVMNDHPPSRT